MDIKSKIERSLRKFDLDLSGKTVLTEAATGNYVVTPIIAALAGADVIAKTKDSKYGSINDAQEQTDQLAGLLNVSDKIKIVKDYHGLDLKSIDILTNTGFNRPIDRDVISKLSPNCVIPLMWEPWEYRESDLDLKACHKSGIKVYGTNESDSRLQTMSYIGYIVLHFLLENKRSPYSSNILILGNKHFSTPVIDLFQKLDYRYLWINNYNDSINSIDEFDVVVCLEHSDSKLLIGSDEAVISKDIITDNHLLIHIAGNVDFSDIKCKKIPESPSPFGYMSFTTDYIDNMAVIDLHCAGLKVGEGMLKANDLNLKGEKYKNYMESNFPALAFDDPKYW